MNKKTKSSVILLPNLNNRIVMILILLTLTFAGCDLLEDEDSPCKKTEATPFELMIQPNVNVIYKNGDDFGFYEVKFDVYKEYCNGKISGAFSTECQTNEEGRASFSKQFTYKFANTNDKVYFTYKILQGAQNMKHAQNGFTTEEGRLVHLVKGEISYEQASKYPVHFNGYQVLEMDIDWFNRAAIKLPWNLKDVYFEKNWID